MWMLTGSRSFGASARTSSREICAKICTTSAWTHSRRSAPKVSTPARCWGTKTTPVSVPKDSFTTSPAESAFKVRRRQAVAWHSEENRLISVGQRVNITLVFRETYYSEIYNIATHQESISARRVITAAVCSSRSNTSFILCHRGDC